MCAENGFRGRRARGLTLVELIVFIVVVSVGLAGILVVINLTVKSSADPIQRKQAISLAESILEEVLTKDATATLPEVNFNTCPNRTSYVGVRDYTCFDGAPATAVIAGSTTLGAAPDPALAALSATVAVADITVSGQALVRVTVRVSGSVDGPVEIVGYRAAGF